MKETQKKKKKTDKKELSRKTEATVLSRTTAREKVYRIAQVHTQTRTRVYNWNAVHEIYTLTDYRVAFYDHIEINSSNSIRPSHIGLILLLSSAPSSANTLQEIQQRQWANVTLRELFLFILIFFVGYVVWRPSSSRIILLRR